jgi:hypothetical protein
MYTIYTHGLTLNFFSLLEDKYSVTIQNAVETVSTTMGISTEYPCIMDIKIFEIYFWLIVSKLFYPQNILEMADPENNGSMTLLNLGIYLEVETA